MTKESDEYELLVQELHDALVKSDGVENITVLHNVKIMGKSGAPHQIDVYWEFKLAGVTYKTCIECKHFKSTVKKSHIAAFSAILDDIGNATGIFATSTGYQSGAKLFAKEKGIRLVLVNHLLKTISIKGKFIIPSTTITNLEFDKEHVKEILKSKNLNSYNYNLRVSENDPIYDEKGNEIGQINTVLKNVSSKAGEGKVSLKKSFFPTEIGNVRLLSIKYTVSHSEMEHSQEITVNDTSSAILEDVLENTSCYLNDDGTITEIET